MCPVEFVSPVTWGFVSEGQCCIWYKLYCFCIEPQTPQQERRMTFCSFIGDWTKRVEDNVSGQVIFLNLYLSPGFNFYYNVVYYNYQQWIKELGGEVKTHPIYNAVFSDHHLDLFYRIRCIV